MIQCGTRGLVPLLEGVLLPTLTHPTEVIPLSISSWGWGRVENVLKHHLTIILLNLTPGFLAAR